MNFYFIDKEQELGKIKIFRITSQFTVNYTVTFTNLYSTNQNDWNFHSLEIYQLEKSSVMLPVTPALNLFLFKK